MKKRLLRAVLSLVLLAPGIADAVAIHTMQVTLGAGATQLTTSPIFVRQVIFQNNATHTVRVGDAAVTSSRGALLIAGPGGGTMNLGENTTGGEIDLSTFWLVGTNTDVIDVIYIN